MAKKTWQLSRRTILRGGGVALALPLLNSMQWANAATSNALPKRLLVSYIAYGVYDPQNKEGKHDPWSWYPCREAGELAFNESTAPFAPLKEYVSYFRGLDHAGGHGLGGHSSGDVFATGADMSGTEKTNNISIDQLAAKLNGHKTRYPSLVLGSEGGTGAYGSAKTLSHYGAGRPIPALHRPQEIFNLLFNPYAGKSVERVRAELKREASVLDLLLEDAKSLHTRLGQEDQRKLDEYFESMRALEQRVEITSQWTHEPLPQVETKSLNLEASYQNPLDYVRCMYDLLYLAFVTDSTRYASYMIESESSTSHEVGKFATCVLNYKGQTHDIAHKRPQESGLWDKWRAEQHAYFLERLRKTPEGEGNMLDRTLVLWGSAHPHASHSTKNYPIQLAGGNALGIKHGKLHNFIDKNKVPLANLFVTMLNAVDAPTTTFADSTEAMTW
jgi:Protein of unknown function (DUF1552)